MKSKEFIIEGDIIGKERIRNWAKVIKRDCQPYLKSHNIHNHMLRGLGREMVPFVEKEVRLENRNPLDTSKYLHKSLNDLFTEKYGAPYRNALFVSGAYNLVKDYGRTYKIFPIGEFNYLWGGSDDLYNEYQNFDIDKDKWNEYILANPLDKNDTTDLMHRRRIKFKADAFLEYVDELNYRTTDLAGAIESGYEIMIRCKSYYAISDYLPDHVNNYLMELLNEK